MERNKSKLIAYYLPQFYETDINNESYGKGYTEWTTVANAKSLYKGHYQPHVPADFGFYNLLMPEVREAQAEMAKVHGVDGFCYWHYWFGNGETTLEKPYEDVVESGTPDFPFCLCWANHTWWSIVKDCMIKKQEYPGKEDYCQHFHYLLKGFQDKRYMQADNGRLIFGIFAPLEIPDVKEFMDCWNTLAKENGLAGFYFVGICQHREDYDKIKATGVDAINTVRLFDFIPHQNRWKELIKYRFGSKLHTYKYEDAAKYFVEEKDKEESNIPTIIPGWDHSPRNGKNSLILTDYTPDAFEKHVRATLDIVSKKQNKLCFIKAWNEWGEGNHLEPDLKWGRAFLEVLKKVKDEYQ